MNFPPNSNCFEPILVQTNFLNLHVRLIQCLSTIPTRRLLGAYVEQAGLHPHIFLNLIHIWMVINLLALNLPSNIDCILFSGGLISNNPTLDLLAEVQNMNKCNQKLVCFALIFNTLNGNIYIFQHKEQDVVEIGLVVSLGTGLIPKSAFDKLDFTSFTSYSGLLPLLHSNNRKLFQHDCFLC